MYEGNYEEASKNYEKSLGMRSYNEDASVKLAKAVLLSGFPEKASQLFDKILSMGSNDEAEEFSEMVAEHRVEYLYGARSIRSMAEELIGDLVNHTNKIVDIEGIADARKWVIDLRASADLIEGRIVM